MSSSFPTFPDPTLTQPQAPAATAPQQSQQQSAWKTLEDATPEPVKDAASRGLENKVTEIINGR